MIPFPTETLCVSRTMDARHLNTVANDPQVRGWLGGESSGETPVDLTALVEDPANVAFATPHGGFLAVALGSGRYDVHSLFLPAGRGREAALAQRDALAYMFAATDATDLRTTVPTSNTAAAVFARRAGFEPLFTSRVPWTADTVVEAECCALSIDRWALKCARAQALGTAFHAALEQVKKAHGSPCPTHPEDPVHDGMVGATALLLQAGNAEKAVRFYNVWASCAHYQQIALLRLRPILVDLGDAVIEVACGGMEVLRCR